MNNREKLETLDCSPATTGAPLDVRQLLAEMTRAEAYLRGELIWESDEWTQRVYVVHTGRLELRGVRSVQILQRGDFVGLEQMFGAMTSKESVRAVEHTTLLGVSAEQMKAFLHGHPEVLWKVCELVVRGLAERGLLA